MTLYQSGESVSGFWIASGGLTPMSGQLTGAAVGYNLEATLIVPTGSPKNVGTYSGTLHLSGQSLTGSISGNGIDGSFAATLALTQQK